MRAASDAAFDSPDSLTKGPDAFTEEFKGPLVPDALLAAGIRIVVWDFDQTVLRIHSWGAQILPSDVDRRNIDKDFADKPFFMAVVTALRAKDITVAIASFGRYETIQRYLDVVFGEGVFTRDTISTPSTVGSRDGYSVSGGKNKQLNKFAEEMSLVPASFLFFDGALGGCWMVTALVSWCWPPIDPSLTGACRAHLLLVLLVALPLVPLSFSPLLPPPSCQTTNATYNWHWTAAIALTTAPTPL